MPLPERRPVRSRAQTRQLWVERLKRFHDSGASAVAFCRNEGISSHAFYYWKNKLYPHPSQADQPFACFPSDCSMPPPSNSSCPTAAPSASPPAVTSTSSAVSSMPWGASRAEPLARSQVVVLPAAR